MRHIARQRRLGLDDRVFEGAARVTSELVRPFVAEELVENHTQRVDVGADGERLAEDLFGRGVVRRQRSAGELGEPGLLRLPFVEQLCDPEVEQPDLAIGGDEDICRLKIAMHDELRVRVGDGVRDLHEELEEGIKIELLVAAILVNLRPSTYSIARKVVPPQ